MSLKTQSSPGCAASRVDRNGSLFVGKISDSKPRIDARAHLGKLIAAIESSRTAVDTNNQLIATERSCALTFQEL